MDRETFRKHLIPFADGSIDPELFDEVNEHVRNCPESAAEVEDIRLLKKRLARAFENEKASPELLERIRSAIAVEEDRFPMGGERRWLRWPIPLGIAAAVAVVWIAAQFMPRSDLQKEIHSPTSMQARYVGGVREQHYGCTRIASSHHRDSLERDLDSVASVLGGELGFAIIAPDLTELGYRFHSADNCGFAGVPASHLVYQRQSDALFVSLFCTARLDDFSDAQEIKRGFRKYLVSRESGSATVAAWHDGQRTHILCGEIDLDSLIALADVIG